MDRCTQLVLHPLKNVQPVQLVVQEMAESAVVLPRVTDDASGSIQYSLELAHGRLGCPSENGADNYFIKTRSSAIAEGPRDASCQLKYCQLPRNSAETTYTTSPDQIDGMKLEI